MDEVFIKTNASLLTYKYEIAKIIIHTTIAYKLSKYIIKKLNQRNYLKLIKPKLLFWGLFMLFNSYLLTQYISRIASTQIINYEVRKSLGNKLTQTNYSGTGYEGFKLTILEYEEINKYSNLLNLPKEASDIYIFDWYGMQDYNRIVEFTVESNFELNKFFQDSIFLKNIELLTAQYDTINSKRYKWETGGI